MRVPPSFGLAYLEEYKVATELKRIAGTRVQTTVCQPNQWLFDDRIKPEESALAKLQLGPIAALGEMRDMYATTVVVPTPTEVRPAVDAVLLQLPDAREQTRRQGDPQTFVYDDVHVIARLGDTAPGLAPGLQEREFEIQIRTGLQYAWWRATHDVVYKGGARTWRLSRLASQARASLEMLDAVLADLDGAAALLPEAEHDEDRLFERVAGWLERWPAVRRPVDVARFYASVEALATASGRGLDNLERVLDTDTGVALVGDEEVTPFQAILGALVQEDGPNVVDSLPRDPFVLVTPELTRSCPSTDAIPVARRARL